MLRLAMRVEGDHWNAYAAKPDTMDGALWIGSIMIASAKRNPQVKQQFMALMQLLLSDAIEQMTGERPKWSDPVAAPDHEKTSGEQ